MALSFETLAKHRNTIIRRTVSILIVAVGIVLDILTKNLATRHLKGGTDVSFIDGILSFSYLENRGAAWGMFSEDRWVFMTISTVTIVVLTYLIFSGFCRTRVMEFSVAAILAGGIGNMIDRVSLGYVVDMIKTDFMDFPIFNVADCFVTVGTAILLVAMVWEIVREERIARRDAEYDQLLAELEARGEFDEEQNEAFFDSLRLDGIDPETADAARCELDADQLEKLRLAEDLESALHERSVNAETARRALTDSLLPEDAEGDEDEEVSEDELPTPEEEDVL